MTIKWLLERMGLTEKYAVWEIRGGLHNCSPVVNDWGMEPPELESLRGNQTGISCSALHNTVHFTYAEDYGVLLVCTASNGLTDEELAVLYDFFYKRYAEYIDKTGREKLARIVDSVKYATASLDLEDVFSNILGNTLDVITNADYGTLWLFDETRGKLVCKASEGYRFDEVRQMEFDVGEGPVGAAFQDGRPVLINDPAGVRTPRMKRISEGNKRKWGRRVEDITNVQSVIAYPIGVDGRIECVMYLGQMQTGPVLTERDLWLLQIFTAQVGIAIRNARQFASIRELNENLLQRDAIHAALTDLSVRNKGTDKVIGELSRMAGQPLVFADLLMNEMIPPAATLPVGWTYRGLLQLIEQEEQAARIELVPDGKAAVYPIRSGTVVLGCLIAASADTLSRPAELALEQGSTVLALERVQKQNVLAFYFKNQHSLFEDLLRATDPEIISETAEALGIRTADGYAAAIFQLSGCADPQEMEAHIFRTIAEIRSSAGALIQFVFGWQNRILLLAGVEGTAELSIAERQLDSVLAARTEDGNGYRLTGGIGSIVHSVNQIERSYREAEIALTNPLATAGRSRLIRYTDIGISRLFTSRNTEEVAKFLEDIFQPLRIIDKTEGTLEQTLITYFAANRSAGETADKLHIHINTLYQRLRKIEETLGLSLKSADDTLQLQLACYLQQLAQTGKTPPES